MKILLMGNPNVGKSALFSHLTGLRVIVSNYPGTTVGYSHGRMKLGEITAEIVDVPGTYSLDPQTEAERVAVRMLEDGDVVINVVDATNLERNLYLTLQLLERKIPVVVALNMWDETAHRGISIDPDRLSALLGVPVVPTVAVTGEGLKRLVEKLPAATTTNIAADTTGERWATIGTIVKEVQRLTHHHHTLLERLGDASVKPLTGGILAVAVLAGSFLLVRFIGESLINYVLNPLFNGFWAPLLAKLSTLLNGTGTFHDIFVGKLIDGKVDFMQSFGLLSSGLYVPLGMVLPYVLSYYFALGLLEDIGYLPRLAVLMDTIMHRLGLHGYAIIPSLLGFGCNVPGILATRILESRRERFIAATLISIAIPCAALQAMIFGVVGRHGGKYVGIVYGTLLVVWIIAGAILRRCTKGFAPELLIEIPPYRRPRLRITMQKLWMRASGFLKEAVPVILLAVLLINIVHLLGILHFIGRLAAPLIAELWGLPEEAATSVVIGFLRKDMAVAMLVPLNLSAKQAVVAGTVLATFTVLFRELGIMDTLKAIGVMSVAAFTVGAVLNFVL